MTHEQTVTLPGGVPLQVRWSDLEEQAILDNLGNDSVAVRVNADNWQTRLPEMLALYRDDVPTQRRYVRQATIAQAASRHLTGGGAR